MDRPGGNEALLRIDGIAADLVVTVPAAHATNIRVPAQADQVSVFERVENIVSYAIDLSTELDLMAAPHGRVYGSVALEVRAGLLISSHLGIVWHAREAGQTLQARGNLRERAR